MVVKVKGGPGRLQMKRLYYFPHFCYNIIYMLVIDIANAAEYV